jgi:hypothetical protein
LNVFNGSQWILVGPPTSPGTPITSVLADAVSDGVTSHTVGNLVVNNKLVAIYSTESYSFNPSAPRGGLTTINPGLNITSGFYLTTPSVTTSNITSGNISTSTISTSTLTATSTTTLNTVNAGATTVTSQVVNGSLNVTGISTLNAVGAGAVTATSLSVSGTSTLASVNASGTVNAATLQQGGAGVLTTANYGSYIPALTGAGASGTWGISITGLAAEASTLYCTSTSDYRQGHVDAASYSIAQRDSGGNLTSNYFYGIATQAEYADLAERFASDTEYPVGTVMELGGSAEVTACTLDASENVFGVISTAPAYLMNREAGSDETHPAIALSGRVPVRVIGTVNKNDRLVSAGNGLARSASRSEITAFNVIGRALEAKTDAEEGVIEAIVRIAI